MGETIALYLESLAKRKAHSPPTLKTLQQLKDLGPITGRGPMKSKENARKLKGKYKEYAMVTGNAVAAYMQRKGQAARKRSSLSSALFSLPEADEDMLMSLICCLFTWPRSAFLALLRFVCRHAADLFRDDSPSAEEQRMLDKLSLLGEVYMVDCFTDNTNEGSAMYGPGMMAALFQVFGIGGQALTKEQIGKGKWIQMCYVLMDGAPWNTEMEEAWAKSKEMRGGDAHEDVQFEIGNDILADIMQLMTGERLMEA